MGYDPSSKLQAPSSEGILERSLSRTTSASATGLTAKWPIGIIERPLTKMEICNSPMACRSISRLHLVRRTTIGCVRFSSVPCFHKRCYSRIADTTWIGSASLPASKEHGRTFRRNEIAKTRPASARICIARNLIERFFNKIKQCRRVATRYDKLAANHLAFVKLASIRIWPRANESALESGWQRPQARFRSFDKGPLLPDRECETPGTADVS
ncbi:transposase [Rhizobium paranaense]|uniref:Transposase n=1 Tax=Rhizobium paranaense TaxID=1650438 RepID=A0A7W8XSU7_9HYPH|nr:transposase [Rhizobium paranaense]